MRTQRTSTWKGEDKTPGLGMSRQFHGGFTDEAFYLLLTTLNHFKICRGEVKTLNTMFEVNEPSKSVSATPQVQHLSEIGFLRIFVQDLHHSPHFFILNEEETNIPTTAPYTLTSILYIAPWSA